VIRRVADGRRLAADERGQGVVEFSLAVPVFLLLLVGMLEFGFAFDATLNLEYASREGARTGASLANGTGTIPCNTTDGVDANIIAAVERVLTSQGSPLQVDRVQEIRIFKATSTGAETAGKVNVWTYSASAGPTVDGTKLHFVQGTVNWSACGRDNGSSPDSVGIGVKYRYDMRTPLSGILRFFGGPGATQLQISDKTVMALNP
jgi:Flp pilus assembly protein TadG